MLFLVRPSLLTFRLIVAVLEYRVNVLFTNNNAQEKHIFCFCFVLRFLHNINWLIVTLDFVRLETRISRNISYLTATSVVKMGKRKLQVNGDDEYL